MASFKVDMEKFDETVEDWPTYIERLEQCFIANSITDDKKVATLLSLMGAKLYGLLKNLCAPAKPSAKTYSEIVAVLSNHMCPKPLTVAERFKFHKRQQHEGESISAYVADLKKLSIHCNFRTYLDEALCDQFVCGLRNENVQKRLLSESELSFAKATEIAVAMETAAHETASFHNKVQSQTNRVSTGKTYEQKKINISKHAPASPASASASASKSDTSTRSSAKAESRHCYRCGDKYHLANNCKHAGSVCNFCHTKGHLSKVCRKKARSSVHYMAPLEENSEDPVAMYMIRTTGREPILLKSLLLDGVPSVPFELDTGSTISAMSLKNFRSILPTKPLRESKLIVRSYTGHTLNVLGVVTVRVEYENQTRDLELYIVPEGLPTVFGRDWLHHFKLPWENIKTLQIEKNPDGVNALLSQYKEIFKEGIGQLKDHEVHLYVKDNTKPVFHKPRSVPYALRDRIERELDRLIEQDIIEPCTHSEWATPVVPVVKPDGSIRLCGDFKVTINPVLQVDQYPLPKIEDIFANLAGGQRYSKIDLSNAYLHMLVAEKDRNFLTINTHRGLYRFKRLPYGVNLAPAVWQRTMEQVLKGIPGVQVFLDDIIITGPDSETHLARLKLVLDRLEQFGLRVNLKKSVFFADSVTYCGHRIDKDGLHKTQEKVAAILNVPRPTSADAVRSFVGLANYYMRFFPDLSTTLHPLYELLKKNTAFLWTSECEASFQSVKREMASDRFLVHFNPALPITLSCDASSVGLGVVLSHIMPDGSEQPIAFSSRTLNKAELNYSQIEKEALSIVWGVKRFHQYLFGRRFTLITDHKPLLSIFSPRASLPTLSAVRILHYAIFLQGFQYDIQYRSTTLHGNADALSRIPTQDTNNYIYDEAEVFNISQFDILPVTATKLARAVENDDQLRTIRQCLLSGSDFPPDLKTFGKASDFSVSQGCVMRGSRVAIPSSLRLQLLEELHIGHFGLIRMKALARSFIWWPGIDNDISEFVQNCVHCSRVQKNPQHVSLHPWEWPSAPWQRLHLDFAGPFLEHMFLIVVDAHSKWPEVIPMTHVTSKNTIDVLRPIFARFGLPQIIVTDNGPQFVSAEFKAFLGNNGIRHITSAPYRPATNGLAERFVQTFKNSMRSMTASPTTLQQSLSAFLLQYRKMPHATTGESPAQLLLGRDIRSRLNLVQPNVADRVERTQMRSGLLESKDRIFTPGQSVSVRNYTSSEKWKSGTIVAKHGHLHYDVQVQDRIWRRHVDQIRPGPRLDAQPASDPTDSTTAVPPDFHQPSPDISVPHDVPPPVADDTSSNQSPLLVTPCDSAPPRRYPLRARKAPDRFGF